MIRHFLLLLSLSIALAGCSGISNKTVGIRVDDAAVDTRQVEIMLASNGTLLFNGQVSELDAVGTKATEALSLSAEEPLFVLKVNRETDNSLIVSVMYELSKVGITNVAVVADE
ncbi:MAG: hypothetical protein QNJ14_11785 [Woeseiaceae bacterium]|nr:hypothetical protein [Woeseiaceae bacterium]